MKTLRQFIKALEYGHLSTNDVRIARDFIRIGSPTVLNHVQISAIQGQTFSLYKNNKWICDIVKEGYYQITTHSGVSYAVRMDTWINEHI